MINKVIKTIKRYNMLKNTDSVTVALSGGADSVALLHCMLSLKDMFGISVFAVHLNHNLRGDESDRDEQFVRELCQKWQVPLTVQSTDVGKISKDTGESIELAARHVRYDFFKKNCHGVIATAHTASDSAETLIFNITRGTALSGLCGIPSVRDIYIRPLINCTRSEIEQYCKNNNLQFVNDSTNFTDDYTRNKIRHKVVSTLKQINPSFENTVTRMCGNLKEDDDFISLVAMQEYEGNISNGLLKTDKFGLLHPAVAKRVLKIYFKDRFKEELDSVNLDLLYKTAKGEIAATVLPGKIKAQVKNGFLHLDNGTDKVEYHYKTEIIKENIEKINNLLLKNTLDCGKIVGALTVRTRESSDKIRLANRGVTKSLKKLFMEMKIPESERSTIPVVCDANGIVWVYGIGVAERVRVDNNTKEVFIINAKKY